MVPCGSSIDLFCGELTVLEGTHEGAQAVYNCYTTGETRTQVAYCRQSGAWWFPVQDCRKYNYYICHIRRAYKCFYQARLKQHYKNQP